MSKVMNPAISELLEGNQRFTAGNSRHKCYSIDEIESLSTAQVPLAAVVACSDSRVAPEVVFDQPLGKLFVSRVPGNVASDSAKWMIDIAVGEFKVPLLIVMGHTGCLAVQQVYQGKDGPGGILRYQVQTAVLETKSMNVDDPLTAAIENNTRHTVRRLQDESSALRDAIQDRKIEVVGALYDMTTGQIRILD